MDALFAAAAAAQKSVSGAPHEFSPQAFDEGIANQVYTAWINSGRAPMLQGNREDTCSLDTGCRGEAIHVRLLRDNDNNVHACTMFCPHYTTAHRHLPECGEEYEIQGSNLNGCVYACPLHLRVHACGPWCTVLMTDLQNARVCVLSGRVLALHTMRSFEDDDCDGGGHASGATTRYQTASVSKEASDAVRPNHQNRGRERRHTHRQLESIARAPLHPDEPRVGLFPEANNTFGRTFAADLDTKYAMAYTVVETLLFSQDRFAVEQDVVKRAHSEAMVKVRHQSKVRRSGGGLWSVCDALACYRYEMQKFKMYPRLVLPHGAINRLCAYYSLLCVEFHHQLLEATTHNLEQANARMKPLYRRVLQAAFVHVVPVFLELFQRDIVNEQTVLFRADWFIKAYYPEGKIREVLLPTAGHRTKVRKDILQVIASLFHSKVASAQLALTTLPVPTLMYETEQSVVTAFLEARKARIVI